MLMGMGSPDNRRKADGSYQTQGVGRSLFAPAAPEKGRIMAGLPRSLTIAIWFVAALWVVGAAAYCFDYPPELLGFTVLLGLGVAFAEWQAQNDTSHKRK